LYTTPARGERASLHQRLDVALAVVSSIPRAFHGALRAALANVSAISRARALRSVREI